MNFGDQVPDVIAQTTLGQPFKLSSYRGRYVVIYFFPKAFTPGCTRVAQQFRDNYAEISRLGAEVVGVSTDAHAVQCDFAQQMKVQFPMVGDPTGQIVEAFGAKWPVFNLAQRATFIIDPDGKLAGYFHHELRISQHANDVVAFLSKLQKSKA
jgi:peroxiredoxin Q/BCP